MILKKSMISIAAATLLAVGFTGCNTDSTTTASNSTSQINTPKGTVTGLVQDTNGNPISGVKVYLADKETTTNSGGLYTFKDVPVSTTNGADAANANQVLSITIAAPTGYLGATVTVTPGAQIDSAENVTTGSTTSGSETFIDGYLAQAGTAVLPHLGATVSGKLELATAETPIANQEISLDFLNVSTSAGANVAQPQNGVATTYSTGSYTATTDANGMFTFTNLPADTDLTYVVPNFTVVGEQVAQGTNAVTVTTNAETSVVNIGDLQVNPVVNNDVTAPFVVSTVGQIASTPTTAIEMLEDDVRSTIVINFSEAMVTENDDDATRSIIVKAGLTRTTMTDRTATVTASGSTLTVVLDTPLVDNELLDINLLVSDFKDTAGNFLTLNTIVAGANNVNYDYSVNAGQIIQLQYRAFNDLNTNAAAVTTVAQQTLDTNGATDDAALLQAKNNAFNDVSDSNIPNNTIWQMNSSDDDDANLVADVNTRLTALGTSVLGAAVTMVTDVPRVTFTPSGAAAYQFKATRAGADINLNNGNFAVQNGATVATLAAGTANANGTVTTLMTPASAGSVTPIEFTVATGTVRVGDVITITPLDDIGYTGTSTTLTLADNVAPTTILQKSYGLGNTSNGASTVVKFGDSGELADTTGTVTVGTPYLAITAGLLDNKNAAGTTVTGVIPSDNTLAAELYALNTVNTTTGTAYLATATGMYDTVAWAAFNTDTALTRNMGIGFSEDVSLNGITPTTTNISSTLSNWTVNNDTTINDDNVAVNSDLIDVTVSNVLTLANTDAFGVIDFTGISDTATVPNVTTAASNAKVVVQDKMPSFVTKASFDGTNVIIDFNEPMKALAAGETISITSAAGATRTAVYAAANSAKYVWSNSNKTLTVATSEFAGLTKADFDFGSYIEAAYGTVARQHAALSWTIADAKGNDWAAENAGVTAPKFAIADLIGTFTVTTNQSGFTIAANTTTTVQTAVWTFAHPIRTTVAGDIFLGVAANAAGDYVWTGSVAADLATINAWFETTTGLGGAVQPITDIAAPNATSLTLSADKKTLTFKFTTTTDADATSDAVRMIAGKTITSGIDTTQTVVGNALIANAQ